MQDDCEKEQRKENCLAKGGIAEKPCCAKETARENMKESRAQRAEEERERGFIASQEEQLDANFKERESESD